LTERYDKLCKPYNDGPGISREGENYFVGAANRDTSLTTAKKLAQKKMSQKRRLEQHFLLEERWTMIDL
jgi:hypothetical protein